MSDRLPPLFDGIDPAALDFALQQFRRIDVPDGTPLMEEGDEDASLICIADGQVEIETGGVKLGKAGPGDIIGEMALFGSGLRTASVRSCAASVFLMLDRAGYESLRDAGSPVAKALEDLALTQLTQRLRDVNRRIGQVAAGTAAANVTPDPGVFQRVANLFGGLGGRSWTWGVDKVGALRQSSVFQTCSDAQLEQLAAQMGAAKFSSGHFICTQGEYGREMYLLTDGLVEVIVTLDAERVENLAQLDPGDVFGMASLIEDLPRMASCVARGAVTALTLDRDKFLALKDANSPAGSALRTALIRGLVDQLAYANGQLALLDIENKRKTGSFLTPLLRARAGTEARGRQSER